MSSERTQDEKKELQNDLRWPQDILLKKPVIEKPANTLKSWRTQLYVGSPRGVDTQAHRPPN